MRRCAAASISFSTEMADLGRIILQDPDDPGDGSGFTVLALGKHGAGELNYSSDIDLVVFFDPQSPRLARGRGGADALHAHRPASREAPAGAHRRRFRAPRRLPPSPRSRLDADGGLASLRLHLLRNRRPELGARRAYQGAPRRRRSCAGRAFSRRSTRHSSGANISTSPPSPTCMR